MKEIVFKISLISTAVFFIIYFGVTVIPPLMESGDIMEAIKAGFVNPFSSAYSMDAILSWVVLAIWIAYESNIVKYGWVCLLLGLVPGVVVAFALYLLLRLRYLPKID